MFVLPAKHTDLDFLAGVERKHKRLPQLQTLEHGTGLPTSVAETVYNFLQRWGIVEARAPVAAKGVTAQS
jgi:hypothetical protein